MSRKLFDFASRADVTDWSAVDDRVMGGLSHSQLLPGADGVAHFTGTVSLARGGGFASVRSRPQDLAAPGATAYSLQVCGDGKRYKLNVRTDDTLDGVNYQVAFATAPGAWTTVHLPLADFCPTFRGRLVAAPPLDPGRARQLGLMVADRQAGPFDLLVRWIRAD